MKFSTCAKIGFGLSFGYSLGKFCADFTTSLLVSVTDNVLSRLIDGLDVEEQDEEK